jgi:hypothetical protein
MRYFGIGQDGAASSIQSELNIRHHLKGFEQTIYRFDP